MSDVQDVGEWKPMPQYALTLDALLGILQSHQQTQQVWALVPAEVLPAVKGRATRGTLCREHFCRNQRPDLLSLLMALENAQKRIQSQGILWHRFPLPHILHIAHSGSLLRSASARNLREERRAVPKPGRLAPFLTNLSIEPLTMLLFDGLAPLLANPGKIRGAILLIDGSSAMFGFGHCSFCCHGTPSFGLCVCCLMNAWLSSTVSGPFKHPGSSEQQYPLLFLSCFFCVIPWLS